MTIKKDLIIQSSVNLSLADRLQEKKEGQNIHDFIQEFLGNFISPETKRAYMDDLAIFFHFFMANNIF